MDQNKLKSVIESILFVSGEPVSVAKISKITETLKAEVENALMMLGNEYAGRGLQIVRKENDVQMTTSAENSDYIDGLVKSEIQENLSQAALEVLSIISYRGPITRVDMESIRGVNCSFTLRSLLMRGLIERIENPKDARGYLYKISIEFLKKLGVSRVEELPDWEEMNKDSRLENIVS